MPGQDDHFLINPYGLLFDEITASSLVKIDAEGNKVEPSEARQGWNPEGALRRATSTDHSKSHIAMGLSSFG